MPRNRILTVALLAVVAAACDGKPDDRRVVGELASDRLELIAEVNEPILDILVAEGEPVRAGQLILRQDDTRASARLAEAEAAAAQARARLDELVRGPRKELILQARANLDGAKHDLEFRELRYARARDLFEKELGSEENRDRAEAQLDAAKATLALRRAQLEELLAGTTAEELDQAEQALVQAEARRDAARIDVERHEIHAPADGLFDSRLFEPGERPVPGQPVAVMLGGEQAYARIFVPERLRVRVMPGTAAEIHVDGLDRAVPGRVRWIASEAAFTPYFALTERDRGRLTFLAKIDITEERERLPDGVPVEVELLLADGE
jgi:HlyD family secretion protein